MTIYAITNLITGKYYIGKTTKTIKERWSGHLLTAKKKSGHLQNAINKYGKDSFVIEAIASACSLEELSRLECLWILLSMSYDSTIGYNMSMGGQGNPRTEDAKSKISAATKIAMARPEVLAKVIAASIGRPVSPETRAKKSILGMRLVHTDEAKEKIRVSAMGNKRNVGRKHSEESRFKMSLALRSARARKFWCSRGDYKTINEQAGIAA